MADAADSKSVMGNHVRVQVPPPALYYLNMLVGGLELEFRSRNKYTRILIRAMGRELSSNVPPPAVSKLI